MGMDCKGCQWNGGTVRVRNSFGIKKSQMELPLFQIYCKLEKKDQVSGTAGKDGNPGGKPGMIRT
jgi:hypothetical protein